MPEDQSVGKTVRLRLYGTVSLGFNDLRALASMPVAKNFVAARHGPPISLGGAAFRATNRASGGRF
jgi:hypothetical protein